MLIFIKKVLLNKNLTFLTIENLVRLGLGFISSILLARLLPVADFGKYNYILSFSLIFLPLYNFGTDEIAIQGYVDKNISKINQVFTLRLICALCSIVVIPIFFYLFGNDPQDLTIYVFFVSLLSIFRFFDFYKLKFQADLTEYKMVFPRLIPFILVNLSKILILYFYKNWLYILYVSILEIVFFNIAQFFTYKYFYSSPNYNLSISKTFVTSVLPVFTLSITAIIFSKIDQVMIPSLLNYESLSYYSVSAKLVDLSVFFPSIILSLMYPKLIKNNSRYNIRRIYSTMSYISFAFIICFFTIGPFLINFLYGHKYSNAVELIGPYSITLFFHFFTLSRLKVFISKNNQYVLIPISLFSIILNIILNYNFVNRFGVNGAIWATIAAQVFSNFFFSLYSKEIRESNIDLFWGIIKPFDYLK